MTSHLIRYGTPNIHHLCQGVHVDFEYPDWWDINTTLGFKVLGTKCDGIWGLSGEDSLLTCTLYTVTLG